MEAAIDTLELSEYRLGQDVRAGAPAAWEALYDQLSERVFRFLYRLTRDTELAADLTHDTFVRVVERGHQYSGRGSLHGWVFTIARNLAHEGRRRDSDRNYKVRTLLRPDGAEDPPDIELRLVLQQAVADLSEEMRTALLLHDVDGCTHPQIAEMLDIPVGTSKARLSRARAQLRDKLEHAL
jgi:RNA polymerase sigma-70 factor (ECF subfamily)